MTLDDLRALVNDNAVLLSVGGAVLGWSLKTWRERRIRLTSNLWSATAFFTSRQGRSMSGQALNVTLFNGLPHDVGIHDAWMDLRAGGRTRQGPAVQVEGGIRRTIRAQHSEVLSLEAETLAALRAFVFDDGHGPVDARVHLVLGNGSRLTTRWAELRAPREAYDPGRGGAGSDWGDAQAGSVPANGGDTGIPGAVT